VPTSVPIPKSAGFPPFSFPCRPLVCRSIHHSVLESYGQTRSIFGCGYMGCQSPGLLTVLRLSVSYYMTACISKPSMVRHDICRHNYAVERGLVVGFCGQLDCCYRRYYPTARFQSPSSVSDEPARSRPMSC